MNSLKILKVMDKADKFTIKKNKIPDVGRNKTLFIARSGVGKSNMLVNWLCRDVYYNKHYKNEDIYLISPSLHNDDKLRIICRQKELEEGVNCFDSYSDNLLECLYEMIKENYEEALLEKRKPAHSLIILDDCMVDLKSGGENSALERAFVNGRHVGLDIWVCNQYYTKCPSVCRTNADCIVIFDTSDKELDKMADEHASIAKKNWKALFKKHITTNHSWVMINYTNKKKERYLNDNLEYITMLPE